MTRSEVMTRAWELHRATGFDFGDCLREAWHEAKTGEMTVIKFKPTVADAYRRYVGGTEKHLAVALAPW